MAEAIRMNVVVTIVVPIPQEAVLQEVLIAIQEDQQIEIDPPIVVKEDPMSAEVHHQDLLHLELLKPEVHVHLKAVDLMIAELMIVEVTIVALIHAEQIAVEIQVVIAIVVLIVAVPKVVVKMPVHAVKVHHVAVQLLVRRVYHQVKQALIIIHAAEQRLVHQ
jgi:hypothetical protein